MVQSHYDLQKLRIATVPITKMQLGFHIFTPSQYTLNILAQNTYIDQKY